MAQRDLMGNGNPDSGPASRAHPRRGFVSLASRLALVIFALVAAVSLVIAVERARRERDHYVESKRSAGVMLTELFAGSIAPALDFADAEAVSASLGTLTRNREVLDAAVWSEKSGARFAAMLGASDAALPTSRPPLGVEIRDGYIDIVRPVTRPTGKLLGAVAVRVSLAAENAAFASTRRRIFWLAFGLSALVAGLLVAVVRRTIVTPLRALEKAAARLARGEVTLVIDGREDEVGNLGRTFNGMASVIAERERRISNMNARLQGLLDNMRQAILVFDVSGCLTDERSRLARQVFGEAAGKGASVVDLLYPADSASEVEREAFDAWLGALALAEASEFDELLSLAPREVTSTGEDGERVLEVEFRRAPSEGDVPHFMLLATDVTSQRRLERSAESRERSHQKQLTAVRQLLAGGGQVFVGFLTSARERLRRAECALGSPPELTPDGLEEAFRFVHTLRAESRSFDLERVESIAIELELSMSGARHAPLDAPVRRAALETLTRGLERLSIELDAAETVFVESSPIGRRALEQVTVSRQDVDELFRRLGRDPGEIGRLVARLAARPFGELIATLPEAVQRWSHKDGKLVDLVISGREGLVPPSLCEGLAGALTHLVRNAVAHGIEAPSERRASGKTERGRIELVCRDGPHGVVIGVSDDGAGFDLQALRRQAAERGHAVPEMTSDVLAVACLAGVSTRGVKDDLAGLGVGLGAVRSELERVGYSLRLISETAPGAHILLEPAPPSLSKNESEPFQRFSEARHE
jgi:two-component system, chemotaxis family, sensor kinase CheA